MKGRRNNNFFLLQSSHQERERERVKIRTKKQITGESVKRKLSMNYEVLNVLCAVTAASFSRILSLALRQVIS